MAELGRAISLTTPDTYRAYFRQQVQAPGFPASRTNSATDAERNQPHDAFSLVDPQLYVNRELSLLAFQKRVLEEAQDPHNPLLERVKFLSIFGSNIEEFFMVRVAGLKRQVEGGLLSVAPMV